PEEADAIASLSAYQVQLPAASTAELRQQIAALDGRMCAIDAQIASYAKEIGGMKQAMRTLEKELEFEVYATGMAEQSLPAGDGHGVSVSYFQGYLETE